MALSTATATPPVEHDTRRRIVARAAPLFAARGYSGVGMRELAVEIGLSKSALFHHFPTKLRLYGAVLEACLADIGNALHAADRAQGDPWQRLSLRAEAFVDVLAGNRDHAQLLLRALVEGEPLDPQDEVRTAELTATTIEGFVSLLREGMQGGRFRRVDAAHTVQSVIGMVVYHFASGDFGEGLLGQSVFDPEQVSRRRSHVVDTLRQALCVDA